MALNSALIVLALGLAIDLAIVRLEHRRPLLAGSIVLSLLLWWATEGCGQLLTGTATDVNAGPLLVVLALACWPVGQPVSSPERQRRAQKREETSAHAQAT